MKSIQWASCITRQHPIPWSPTFNNFHLLSTSYQHPGDSGLSPQKPQHFALPNSPVKKEFLQLHFPQGGHSIAKTLWLCLVSRLKLLPHLCLPTFLPYLGTSSVFHCRLEKPPNLSLEIAEVLSVLGVLRFLGPGGLLLAGEFPASVGEQSIFLGGQSHPRALTGSPAGGPFLCPLKTTPCFLLILAPL